MARSIQQRGHHVTCALIGTSRKLAAYNYMSSLALWTTFEYELVDAKRYPKGQSRTCYQECGCHLIRKEKKGEKRDFPWLDKLDWFWQPRSVRDDNCKCVSLQKLCLILPLIKLLLSSFSCIYTMAVLAVICFAAQLYVFCTNYSSTGLKLHVVILFFMDRSSIQH